MSGLALAMLCGLAAVAFGALSTSWILNASTARSPSSAWC